MDKPYSWKEQNGIWKRRPGLHGDVLLESRQSRGPTRALDDRQRRKTRSWFTMASQQNSSSPTSGANSPPCTPFQTAEASCICFRALFSALSETPVDRRSAQEVVDGRVQPHLNKPLNEWLHFLQTPSPQNIEAARAGFGRLSQEHSVRIPGVDFKRPPGKAVHRELSLDVQFTTIDLRRWVPEPFQKERDSIASLQTALPFVVHCDQGSSFESISRGLQYEYKHPFSFANDDLGCLGPGMAVYGQMVAGGQVPPSSSTPYLSSMGVVDHILDSRYGDWELSKYWVSSTMTTGDFQVYLWTWRDQMVFSACYNDAFYESSRVNPILEAIRDQLEIGLGLA
ncbi:hypothetical protein C2857_005087 [Epichloe festucae Fl1]|uniref:Uncharacterized protein n=1 Tax=Epichloe festucae (strain Fl1) TaxID=877507 RepID=A0A7S9KPJ1_EPIFF|nr:hypothetical protein C2857_005087 [Epichloe festucae Fl1]